MKPKLRVVLLSLALTVYGGGGPDLARLCRGDGLATRHPH